MVEVDEVSTVRECFECATVDAYGDEEIAAGWFYCLEDILDDIDECECLGDIVKFVGVVQKGINIFAHVMKNKKSAFVSLESIKFVTLTKVQKLWIKAYLKYQNT